MRKLWIRLPLALFLALAVLNTYSMVALAAPEPRLVKPSGELTVVGEVSVDGTNRITGATILSDSYLTVGEKSNAVISLLNFERIELSPNSCSKLSFDNSSTTESLDAGRVRISKPQGVAATINTKDGAIVAESSEAAVFTVDVSAGHTLVATESGHVVLRSGETAKHIGAGESGTAGEATPGQAPATSNSLTKNQRIGLFAGIAAAIIIIIIIAVTHGDEAPPQQIPNPPNPSPAR